MLRQLSAALRAAVLFTVVLGLAYPLLMTGLAQVAAPGRADGSLVTSADGTVVGSSLVGQGFVDASGDPLAQYFQSRPSAGDWDGRASGGSNLGPSSPDLAAAIASRRSDVASFNGVAESAVPDDAVTTSASGLDPDISPAYAAIQVDRVASSRGVSAADVSALVAQATHDRDLGFIGAPHVDVLELNLALDAAVG